MQVTLGYGSEKHRLEFADGNHVSVWAVLQSLRDLRPGDYARWCGADGNLRRSLAVFVNREHVRYLRGLDTELHDGDEVYVVARITGG